MEGVLVCCSTYKKVEVVPAGHSESHGYQRDKCKQSVQAFTLPVQEISSYKRNVKIIFTKVTLLFTLQVPRSKGYQSIFVAQTSKGYGK